MAVSAAIMFGLYMCLSQFYLNSSTYQHTYFITISIFGTF